MNRALTFLAASACAAVAVSSACFAADWNSLPFHLAKSGPAGTAQLRIEYRTDRDRNGNWSQSIATDQLQGLDVARFGSRSSQPIRFSLIRPAGRFDCQGSARSFDGRGSCGFTANAAFNDDLARRGVGRPTSFQSMQLALGNFRPDVLDALAAAGYPRPTVEQSIALGIFSVDSAYVRGLAASGYRSRKVDDLVPFKIHRVTPEYIRSFANLGYRNLGSDKLVQMRIFNVTPADVQALRAQGVERPTTEQLVQARIFGPRRSRR